MIYFVRVENLLHIMLLGKLERSCGKKLREKSYNFQGSQSLPAFPKCDHNGKPGFRYFCANLTTGKRFILKRSDKDVIIRGEPNYITDIGQWNF